MPRRDQRRTCPTRCIISPSPPLEAVARRQLRPADRLRIRARTSPRVASLATPAPDLDLALQVAALDLALGERGPEFRDLAQRHHARGGVGVEGVARDVDLVEVGDAGALVARQPDQDLVVLAVRAFPLAGELAADHRARGRGDLRHRDAHVARELAVDDDVQRRAGGLEADLDVHGALDRLDPRDHLLRDAVELLDVRPLHEDADRAGSSRCSPRGRRCA